MYRLYIKAFGPLKEIDIELNEINLFIGENGSGKSVLAKLVTILTAFNDLQEKSILKKLKDFNIDYITSQTIIKIYDNESKDDFIFKIENQTVIKDTDWLESTKEIESSQYIPAERNLISLFSQSLSSLVVAEIPLPKFLLHFSSQYEKARNEIKELAFLDVKYYNNGRDVIYYNDKDYLELTHSSSGIQSALPLYLAIKYFNKKNHHAVIIEEPELNLFPKAQSQTIQYIIENATHINKLLLMTHSPYVLSTLNILLYAYKVGSLNGVTKEKVSKLVSQKQWINPDKFSAYYMENGTVRNIKGTTGLISENEIDDSSDEISGQFDALVEIYRVHKNDQ